MIKSLNNNLDQFIKKNDEHGKILSDLQNMADDSKIKLSRLTDETNKNAAEANEILNSMNKSIITIQAATMEAEQTNLDQVEKLAQKAMSHTIQVDDELSFLFELRALFEYLDQRVKEIPEPAKEDMFTE